MSSDTICQLDQLFSNSEASNMRIEGRSIYKEVEFRLLFLNAWLIQYQCAVIPTKKNKAQNVEHFYISRKTDTLLSFELGVMSFPQQKKYLHPETTSFPKNDFSAPQVALSFLQSNLQIEVSQSKLIAQLNYSLFGNLFANIAVELRIQSKTICCWCFLSFVWKK